MSLAAVNSTRGRTPTAVAAACTIVSPAGRRNDAQIYLRLTKFGALAGNNDVGLHRQRAAAAKGKAIDRCD